MVPGRNLKKLIRDVGVAGQYLWQKGWAEKNAGNFSADVTDLVSVSAQVLKSLPIHPHPGPLPRIGGRSYLVTGTGTRFRDIQDNPESCLCVLRVAENLKGFHLLWGGKGAGFKPTSELPSHLLLQASLRRSNSKILLHTHPNELIALSHLPEIRGEAALNNALWKMIPEAKIYVPKGMGWVPYRLSGSRALAEGTLKVLEKGHEIVLWEKHGVVAVGKDALEAFDLIDAMNKSATLYLLCRGAGTRPRGLSRAQIREIGRSFPPKP